MMEDRVHSLAHVKADKILKRRTPSVASGLSAGTEHQTRRNRRYPESLGTISHMDNSHDDEYMRHAVQFENTYQMEPKARFPVAAITRIVQETLATIQDKDYEPNECRLLTKTLSDNIKTRVKQLSLPRYKIICLVHLGELNNQGLRISSRCLWNANFDSFASCEYKNQSMFAVACVYGVYFE